jgi:hypothetical protein
MRDLRDIEPLGDINNPMHPAYREDTTRTYITTLFDRDQLRLVARAMGCTVRQAVERLEYAEIERRERGEL